MSIVGLGSDIVAVGRIGDLIERYGDRFLGRCFRPQEVSYIQSRGLGSAASAAARWAAKEAFLKALNTDVEAIPYRDIEVLRDPSGPVGLRLHGRALEAVRLTGATSWHLALSHEKEFALATVILESGPVPETGQIGC